jgi:hypothetical protein
MDHAKIGWDWYGWIRLVEDRVWWRPFVLRKSLEIIEYLSDLQLPINYNSWRYFTQLHCFCFLAILCFVQQVTLI